MREKWRIWNEEKNYGDTFFDRAKGNLPEMESSKAVAKKITKLILSGEQILDIGCGGGHYLVSLDKELDIEFKYTGVDSTEYYIQRATEAFLSSESIVNPNRISTNFLVGDIFNLPIQDNFAEVVMCNNVLLHLPSIEKPIKELIRVSKKYVIIRMLIGNTAFRIKHVKDPEIYNEDGDPENFYFYNIYSENYIQGLIKNINSVKVFTLESDTDFNPDNIGVKEYRDNQKEVPFNVTKVFNGMQVNNYIIQPWKFLIIEKNK